MDVSGCVWQVISEFVEMYTCVHLNVYATMCGVAWLRENGYVFECAWMGDFTDLWMVPLRHVPCAFQSLQNCKWQLQEVSQQEVRKKKHEAVIPQKLKTVFERKVILFERYLWKWCLVTWSLRGCWGGIEFRIVNKYHLSCMCFLQISKIYPWELELPPCYRKCRKFTCSRLQH